MHKIDLFNWSWRVNLLSGFEKLHIHQTYRNTKQVRVPLFIEQ